MTKFNSLRSLKKRRKSVDKRGSVKKDRRKVDRRILEEHHNKEPEEEATTAVNEVAKDEPAKHDEQSKEWFPWWNGSVLTDFYSWCQSTVTEGIEVVKDTVIPTRSLRRELCEVTRQLQSMEEKMARMTEQLQIPSAPMDNASSVQIAPPPIAPPPPPIAPPAPPISFKGRTTAKHATKPAKKENKQQTQLVVTLSDIRNVQLKTITANDKTRELPMKSSEGLVRTGLKRCHYTQQENRFHCSPKLLVTTRKKLRTTGIDRTPGGTPMITKSHGAPTNCTYTKQEK